MRRQLLTGLLMTVVLTVLLGLLYPLAVTGVSQVAFAARADGSLVRSQGRVVGSSLLGQDFTGARWFHPRPSAGSYDGLASGASNLGPTNPDLRRAVAERVAAYRRANHLGADVDVPVDAVTASASGLDPHISVADARLQAPRVAAARHRPVADVLRLVAAHTEHRQWGVLGEDAVNVLQLNLALG